MRAFLTFIFIVLPIVVTNSQKLYDSNYLNFNIKRLEAENLIWRQKIRSNKEELDLLINQLKVIKKNKKNRKPIYKRIFKSKENKYPKIVKSPIEKVESLKKIPGDSTLTIADTIPIKTPKKKKTFFKRIIKLFKK